MLSLLKKIHKRFQPISTQLKSSESLHSNDEGNQHDPKIYEEAIEF